MTAPTVTRERRKTLATAPTTPESALDASTATTLGVQIDGHGEHLVAAQEAVHEFESQILYAIRDKIEQQDWSQAFAAAAMDTWQPKVSGIIYGEGKDSPVDSEGRPIPVKRMSTENLLRAAHLLGIEFEINLTPRYKSDNFPSIRSAKRPLLEED